MAGRAQHEDNWVGSPAVNVPRKTTGGICPYFSYAKPIRLIALLSQKIGYLKEVHGRFFRKRQDVEELIALNIRWLSWKGPKCISIMQ